jgi:Tol biopolymer transport system component
VWAPSWSRDGRRIVFTAGQVPSGPAPPLSALYVVNVDGSGLRRLAVKLPSGESAAADADWSPDGQRIAFDACDPTTGVCDILTIDPRGRRLHRFPRRGYESVWDPAWSPDGRFLAFICERNDINDVCVMRANGGGVHVVARGNEATQPAGLTWGR